MSQTYGTRGRSGRDPEPSGWATGWSVFAGVMLMIQGTWWLMSGLVALLNDEFYVVTAGYVFQFDVTTWGWIHLGIGAAVIAAGVGVFSGATWARVVGVVVAGIAMLVGFAWLPYYPIWALLFITTSAFSIWALTAYGQDIAESLP
jgi:hypothetical protein